MPQARADRRQRLYWALFLGTWMALAVVIRWHVRGLDREVRREGLSSASVVACRDVLLDTVDAETGLRGFLVVGRKEFLRPYHEALGRVAADLARLRASLPAGRHDDHEAAVTRLVATVLSEFANQVDAAETRGLEAGRRRFADYPTKPSVDRVREHLLEIQAAEDRRMADSLAELDRSMATTILLLDIFTAVLFLLLVAMAAGFITPPAPTRPVPPTPPG